jgi:hypothetical protein
MIVEIFAAAMASLIGLVPMEDIFSIKFGREETKLIITS